MLSFEPFRIWCVKQKKGKMEVLEELGISTATAAKIWKDIMPIRSDTIEVLCRTYGLRVEEVIEYKPEEDADADATV